MDTPLAEPGKTITSVGGLPPPESSPSSTSAAEHPPETTSKPENNAPSSSGSADKAGSSKLQPVSKSTHRHFQPSEPSEEIVPGLQLYHKISFIDDRGKHWALEKGSVSLH